MASILQIKRGGQTLWMFLIVSLSFAQHPWPMFRYDAQHTGRSEHVAPTNPEEKWHFEISNTEGQSSPAIAQDGTIYVGSMAGQCLYAINPDGTEKWQYTTGGPIFSSPVLGSDGTIYIGSLDSCLYAIDSGGTLQWQYRTNGYFSHRQRLG